MRCKQGELAFIIRSAKRPNLVGAIVKIHSLASSVGFALPDGLFHSGCTGHWVIEFDRRVDLPTRSGGSRKSRFACAPDSNLLPIRDNDGEDEMLRIAGLPNKQPEVA